MNINIILSSIIVFVNTEHLVGKKSRIITIFFCLSLAYLCYNIRKSSGGIIMARGKRLTGIDLLEKKISDLNEKIDSHETIIYNLKEQKSKLEEEMKKIKLEELSSIIEEKGLSIEEVKNLIDNQSSEK